MWYLQDRATGLLYAGRKNKKAIWVQDMKDAHRFDRWQSLRVVDIRLMDDKIYTWTITTEGKRI